MTVWDFFRATCFAIQFTYWYVYVRTLKELQMVALYGIELPFADGRPTVIYLAFSMGIWSNNP